MTKAIILSGGKGTRLMPLTKNIPKPMLPVGEKPHLEYIIRLLKKHGITDIIFSTGYLHKNILDYFGYGEYYGVNIQYREDGDKPLGTAGAIKNCEDLLDDEPFLVFNGDILTNINLTNLILDHKKGITIALAEVEDASSFGLAVLNEERRIKSFIEKSDDKSLVSNGKMQKLINAGIYVMDKDILKEIPVGEFYMVETDVFPKYSMNDLGIYGYTDGSYWLDIGTFDRYKTAIEVVKNGVFKI